MQLKMVVFASAIEGRENEFLTWYDGVHMADMLRVDGIESIQRYDLVREPDRPRAPGHSMTVFTWEVDDVASARAAMAQAQRAGAMPLHDSMDTSLTRSWFFVPGAEFRGDPEFPGDPSGPSSP
jgi:hypothetical protein